MEASLRRDLGFAAVAAVCAGDMLGSGVFFTPGELAAVAQQSWQVYFIWGLCGAITLCGALTLGALSAELPRSGASYHIIREAFGPFWAFLKIWTEMFVAGPGSVAGVAIVFGTYISQFAGNPPLVWGITAILFFSVINLLGVRWGGSTQVVLTMIKIGALLALIFGSLFTHTHVSGTPQLMEFKLLPFLQMLGSGVAVVLFTYDGWIDVSHVAGEVKDPRKNLLKGLAVGVGGIAVLYLLVNYAYLRIVPLAEMKDQPALIASRVAQAAFGSTGAQLLTGFITISIFGALGGLIMTIPRLFYGASSDYSRILFFRFLLRVSSKTSVPWGAIVFCALSSIAALTFFQSFGRLVNFLVVGLQFISILMVAAAFRLKNRIRVPGYPWIPLCFIIPMALLLLSAIYFNPADTLKGIALTATCIPVYFWLRTRESV